MNADGKFVLIWRITKRHSNLEDYWRNHARHLYTRTFLPFGLVAYRRKNGRHNVR